MKNKRFTSLRKKINNIRLGDATLKLLILILSIAFIIDALFN
jgi:hypothetical protein